MRHMLRPAVKLPTLTERSGAKKAAQHVEQWSGQVATRFDFPDHWNEPDVRGALYAMHGRVCAFCLSELRRGDRGDVEHFRPKSYYWWLAYSFENYFLSCIACNRIFKREHFPLLPGTPRLHYDQRQHIAEEQRLLLDPAVDPVEQWLVVDPNLVFWQAAPTLTKDSPGYLRFLETKRLFHWNDDPDLVKARSDAIDEALLAVTKRDWEQARRLASRFRPHGAAVRQIFSANPKLLPTPQEELRWLLEDMEAEWTFTMRLREVEPGELSERKLEELRWAFAVLWKAPPGGDTASVEAWLTSAGLKAEVEPMYAQL